MPLGKIARLPHAIREQLNERLLNHEKNRPLLDWLHSLPEVRKILSSEFDGKPINKTNLTHWRKGGFREWQSRRQALEHMPEMLSEAAKIHATSGVPIADLISDWNAAYYALAARLNLETGDHSSNLKLLQQLCRDVAVMQRSNYRTKSLELGHRRLEFFQKREMAKKVDFVSRVLESLPSRQLPAAPKPSVNQPATPTAGSTAVKVS